MNWIGWALLSALFAAATAILAKLGVANIDSNLATALRTTVILVVAWAIALSTSPVDALRSVDRKTLLFLALSGLATGLSWICYFRALQLGEASKVAPLDKISVVFVVILAALFLEEKVTLAALAGVTLIASGAVILALS